MRKEIFILLLILSLATFLRFWELGSMPSGVTNDEAGIIYSAYSIFKTGHDIEGKFLPLSINLDNSFSPVCIYLTAPFVGFLGVSSFAGRLPFALLGVASVLLLFLITRRIFNSNAIALSSAFVLAVSPWHVHITRVAYDGTIAFFFYLLGIYVFLRKLNKGNICWSLLPFFLGYFSYHATKVFFIFFIPLIIFTYRDILLKRKKETMFFIAGVVAIFASFILVSKYQGVTRQDVFIWNNTRNAAKTVDWERTKNTAPFVLRQVFSNKAIYYLRAVRENYLEAFSSQFLFLYGETGGLGKIYGTFFRGQMHILELPLLVLGLVFLLSSKGKKGRFFVISSVLLAPLPSTFVVDKTYVMRSIMMLPFLSIIVGCGIYYFFSLLQRRKKVFRYFSIGLFVCVYTFLIAEYVYQYHFQYNIYGAEGWSRSNRDLAEYVGARKDNFQNIQIVAPNQMVMLQYSIFNKVNPKIIQDIWKSEDWPKHIGNVSFLQGCIDTHKVKFNPNEIFKEPTLYIVPTKCHDETSPVFVIRDIGEPERIIWKIYEKI